MTTNGNENSLQRIVSVRLFLILSETAGRKAFHWKKIGFCVASRLSRLRINGVIWNATIPITTITQEKHTQCSGSSALFEKCQLIDFCSNLFCWPIFCLINGFSICGCDAMQRHAVIITYMPLYCQLKNYYNISSNWNFMCAVFVGDAFFFFVFVENRVYYW